MPGLLTLQVSFEGVKEESVVGNAVPVEHLLLLLRADAAIAVKEVEERGLWLFERGVGT